MTASAATHKLVSIGALAGEVFSVLVLLLTIAAVTASHDTKVSELTPWLVLSGLSLATIVFFGSRVVAAFARPHRIHCLKLRWFWLAPPALIMVIVLVKL